LLSLGGGVLVAGGILLLYVCWKMYRELSVSHEDEHDATEALANADGTVSTKAPRKSLRDAVIQIVIADVSMSLDNVLAVAGAAQHHFEVLIIGLVFSVLLMGVAASFIARLLHRYRWIAWLGLVIILYVSVRMLYDGADQLLGHTLPAIPLIKG
jgi:YjbE family integral membrane protein